MTFANLVHAATPSTPGGGGRIVDSDGTRPFIAGVIEHNLIRDTIGYNLQVKHQVPWPADPRLPSQRTTTILRHIMFSKGSTSSQGRMARPNATRSATQGNKR